MASVLQTARLVLPIKINLPTATSLVAAGSNTRPLWFDGRFLAAADLAREQRYFLRRQAELGRAGGFGVRHGLLVDQGTTASAETIVVHAGEGVTPSGDLVMLPADLTIVLSDISDEENYDEEFGLSTTPQQPSRTRTGIYVLALRPVRFTANPITSYPASLSSPRVSRDGDIIEATAISLVPYTNPVNNYDVSLQNAALARQIFVTGDTGAIADSLLPVAMISIDRGVIQWIDTYMVRRDSGPQPSGIRLGLADPATQQAYLLQYDAQLQAIVSTRKANGQNAHFAATDYFQALPPVGRIPLDAVDTVNSQQTFLPQQMNVQLTVLPEDELPAVINDSLSLPPIDLTLAAANYANMSVYIVIPVPRIGFDDLEDSLSPLPVTLNPALAQSMVGRQVSPFGIQAAPAPTPAPATSNPNWLNAINSQTYGFYVLRRSEPIFVSFTSPLPPTAPTTTTTAAGTTAAGTTTPATTTTPAPTTTNS